MNSSPEPDCCISDPLADTYLFDKVIDFNISSLFYGWEFHLRVDDE